MGLKIAYISQGTLYLWSAGQPVREIESEFGRGIQERTQRMNAKQLWKNRSLMEMMMPPGVAKKMQEQAAATLPNIAITSICKVDAGRLLYALESDNVSGVFSYEIARDKENRMYHNADHKVSHLALHADEKLIACSTAYPDGTTNIATMPIDGARPRDITEGDSIDLAPRWISGQGKALVYQSAGLARSTEGYICGRGAFAISKLDFGKQEVVTLAEDPKSDLLGPQMDAQGWLYYIRRPYKQRQVGILQMLKSILLIPVHFVQAIYAWLDFFTRQYTGKSLMSTGNERQAIETKFIKAWGEFIQPETLKRGNKNVEIDAPALVPETWQLVRQGQKGSPEVLASGVLHYDLAADGTIFYTNGSAIFQISAQGERQRLLVDKWIENLAIYS
jgi:hypothetical protein